MYRLGAKHSSIFRKWVRRLRPSSRTPTGRASSTFVQVTCILSLFTIICCAAPHADAHPTELRPTSRAHVTKPPAVQSPALPYDSGPPSLVGLTPGRVSPGQEHTILSPPIDPRHTALSAKWLELQSRILSEQETLAACRLRDDNCSAAARQFLSIVELGRVRQGRARLGEINRAVNLSIKPMSDLAQYGVADFWSAPLATLTVGAGDCEDYAVVKYVVLREIGIDPDDLQLVIVGDIKRKAVHAVVAVRLDEEWLILDNRMLVM